MPLEIASPCVIGTPFDILVRYLSGPGKCNYIESHNIPFATDINGLESRAFFHIIPDATIIVLLLCC